MNDIDEKILMPTVLTTENAARPMCDHTKDPICGNCGKLLSEHLHRDKVFCYHGFTDPVYSTEPNEDWVLGEMAGRHPELYDEIVKEWRMASGHEELVEKAPVNEDLWHEFQGSCPKRGGVEQLSTELVFNCTLTNDEYLEYCCCEEEECPLFYLKNFMEKG